MCLCFGASFFFALVWCLYIWVGVGVVPQPGLFSSLLFSALLLSFQGGHCQVGWGDMEMAFIKLLGVLPVRLYSFGCSTLNVLSFCYRLLPCTHLEWKYSKVQMFIQYSRKTHLIQSFKQQFQYEKCMIHFTLSRRYLMKNTRE